MERLTEYDEYGNTDIIGVDSANFQLNLEFNEFNLVTDALNKLSAYEDTGLTPDEIKTLKKQLDISRVEVQGLSKKLVECQKSDADKERYTIELYSRARKAEEKADYWKAEALKHCAKLGEIKLLVGRTNEWQRLN